MTMTLQIRQTKQGEKRLAFDLDSLLSLSCSNPCDEAEHNPISPVSGQRVRCHTLELDLHCVEVLIHAQVIETLERVGVDMDNREDIMEWQCERGGIWAYQVGEGEGGEPIRAPRYNIISVEIGNDLGNDPEKDQG